MIATPAIYPDAPPGIVAHVDRSYRVILRSADGRAWTCTYPAHASYWRRCALLKGGPQV